MVQNVDDGMEAELARLIDGEIDPKKFPHSEHLRFAYEMLSRHSFAETVSLFSAGLKKLAAKSGRPELYHDTITIAFFPLWQSGVRSLKLWAGLDSSRRTAICWKKAVWSAGTSGDG